MSYIIGLLITMFIIVFMFDVIISGLIGAFMMITLGIDILMNTTKKK